MNRLITISTFLILFASCNNSNFNKSYYDSGELLAEEISVKAGEDRKYVEYFKNGDTLRIKTRENGSFGNGMITYFFKNNKLSHTIRFWDNLFHGDYLTYDSITNHIIQRQIFEHGKIKYIEQYDSLGTIVYNFKFLEVHEYPSFDSSFVKLYTKNSYLTKGETVRMEINIPNVPDRNLVTMMSNGVVIFDRKDTTVSYRIRPKDIGHSTITINLQINDSTEIHYGKVRFEVKE